MNLTEAVSDAAWRLGCRAQAILWSQVPFGKHTIRVCLPDGRQAVIRAQDAFEVGTVLERVLQEGNESWALR